MAIDHYTVFTENSDQGGATNPAVTNFYVDTTGVGSEALVAANLIAFFSFVGMAIDSTVAGVSVGASTGGGQLPVAFPSAEYATLVAADPNIYPITAYGGPVGAGFLAVAGSGIVISKHTALPGRSGRGRMTTPWLSQDVVTGFGRISATSANNLEAAFNTYVLGMNGTTGRIKLKSSIGLTTIDSCSVTEILGRVRSRRR